jgi:hypothetical protein
VRGVRSAAMSVLLATLAVAHAGPVVAPRHVPVPVPTPVPVPVPDAVLTDCRENVRLFDSLAAGTFDYCRGHLRYVPGAVDCFRLIDRVCLVYLPASGEFTDTHYPQTRFPFPCPDGPPPPVCRRLDIQ